MATHTNLIFCLNSLYTLVLLLYSKVIKVVFKTETFHLVSNVQLVKWLFTAKRKPNTALPCSFSTVIHNALRY